MTTAEHVLSLPATSPVMQAGVDTFMEYLHVRRQAAENTCISYRLDLCDFARWCGDAGIETWPEVDRAAIRSWLGWMHREGYATSSISRKLAAIRTFYRFLELHGDVKQSPLVLIKAPKQVKYLPSVLTLDEVERLLAQPDLETQYGLRDMAMLEVLYASGMRMSELLSMNIPDIDWENGSVRVQGKGKKERIVLLGERAMTCLETYIHEGRPHLMNGQRDNGAFFLSRLGRRLSQRMFHLALDGYLAAAGLEKRVTPHTLRHTFATHLLEGGADLRVVQELLGHANVSTTQIYTHISEGHLRDEYSKAHPNA